MNIPEQLIAEFKFQPFQVANSLALFGEGATIPFISRYRKEMTGSLDEVQLRDLLHRFEYFTELDERRVVILGSIREQGKLTADLEKKIESTLSKTEIEDLYLPFKPRRITRATKAKEAGLEPLAMWLLECDDAGADVAGVAGGFVDAEKGFGDAESALRGARDILAEQLSDNADVRKYLRDLAWADGIMASAVKKEFKDQKTKFEMYYDVKEGMMLEGSVTNVTNFGAFVDIGVHQDGLVHVSQLSDSFVTDPKTVVHVGQIVRVRVQKVDTALKRISLSMKSGTPADRGPLPRPAADAPRKQQGAAKLVTLEPKFNVRQFMK